MFRVLTLALVLGLFSSAYGAQQEDPGDRFVCGFSATSEYDGHPLVPITGQGFSAATLDHCSMSISRRFIKTGKGGEKWTVSSAYRLITSTLHDYDAKGDLNRDRICSYAITNPSPGISTQPYMICIKHVRALLQSFLDDI